MINAGIAGASGYTGAELVKLIANHPEADIKIVTSNRYKGESLSQIYPAMDGFDALYCEALDIPSFKNKIDVIFLALPHKVSMSYVPDLVENKIKVIDLSADFRFNNAAAYESAYQPHTAENLLQESVYGLCEIFRNEIKESNIIGNPGCYPTSILLPLIPLLKEGLIDSEHIISDSKSGVSGAGRSLSLATHFCEVNETFHPYKVGNHRHTPEINEVLSAFADKNVSITFIPHLLPLNRGMLSTIYASVKEGCREDDIRNALNHYYDDEPFVRILKKNMYPSISYVKGTNRCDIGFHFDADQQRIIIVSVIDNLLKGAAGQALQNMNLQFNLPETMGLNFKQGPL